MRRTITPDVLNQFEKARGLLTELFADEPGKVWLWLDTPNPMLGNITPAAMIALGNGEKLLEWMREQVAENSLEDDGDN